MVSVTMCCKRLLESETEVLMRSLLKQLLFDKNLVDNQKALRDGRLCRQKLRGTVSALCCRTWGAPRKEAGGKPQYLGLAFAHSTILLLFSSRKGIVL